MFAEGSMMGLPCEICGNTVDSRLVACPFCGSRMTPRNQPLRQPLLRTVNLEQGMPTVPQALLRLQQELQQARHEGYRVLRLIHGYGSSGKGGAIRAEVRRQLAFLKEQRAISDFLPGEEFSRRTGPGRQMLRRFPFLSGDRDLNRANPGITLVIP